ncbi:hypothetical protein Tco_0859355 [Tanacetum coccineum]|uniref:Reverse transcriptase domain-containing protein n=1 Tax=Tanacetum coccineum TaxID=301880 RepID=A0ABQ5BER0_9ASTR
MRKYLEKDCVTYLAHIVDKGANVKRIQNTLIERNHTEVFSKYLFGLPPTRIVEFRIDLVSGAASMAKAPYHLAPSEMQELSRKLQETYEQRIDKIEFITLGCTSAFRQKREERRIDAHMY